MTRKEAIGKLPPFRLYGEDARGGWLLDCLVALDLLQIEDTDTVLCKENEDWDWWLKQPPEFKGKVVGFIRMLLA